MPDEQLQVQARTTLHALLGAAGHDRTPDTRAALFREHGALDVRLSPAATPAKIEQQVGQIVTDVMLAGLQVAGDLLRAAERLGVPRADLLEAMATTRAQTDA